VPPVIILVTPQLGENIGMVARAMGNCGLDQLRLVAPRDSWPNPDAVKAAAGADWILNQTQVFATTQKAIADLCQVYATTARSRFMEKAMVTLPKMQEKWDVVLPTGILFGCEKSGLSNEDVTLADYILTIPVNPNFSSLNLAQAVLLVAYSWFQGQGQDQVHSSMLTQPAPKDELLHLFEHLEKELDQSGFFFPPHKRPEMVQNLRNALTRAGLTTQEVRTFRGIIKSLTKKIDNNF